MAWASMHFAVGMGCTAVLGAGVCSIFRRGWRWIPLAMTAGGVWGMAPDLPRIFREDFPNLPFAHWLGRRELQIWLHKYGDVFFWHAQLDAQPREFALHGLAIIIALYTLSIAGLIWLVYRKERYERLLRRPGEK